jgi:hypothetical protein
MGTLLLGRRAIAQLILGTMTVATSLPGYALQRRRLVGTAGAGAAATITLAANAAEGTAQEGFFDGCTITIIAGPAMGDVRKISGYVGSTRVATVSVAWSATPTTASVYSISHDCEGVPAQGALVKVETAAINVCLDGSAPTAAAGTNIGLQMDPGESLMVDDADNVKNLKIINRVNASGSIAKVVIFG